MPADAGPGVPHERWASGLHPGAAVFEWPPCFAQDSQFQPVCLPCCSLSTRCSISCCVISKILETRLASMTLGTGGAAQLWLQRDLLEPRAHPGIRQQGAPQQQARSYIACSLPRESPPMPATCTIDRVWHVFCRHAVLTADKWQLFLSYRCCGRWRTRCRAWG